MTLHQIESKTKFTEDGILRRDEFEIGSYKVVRITHYDASQKPVYKSFSVISNDEYAPEIYYNDGCWEKCKSTFEIQTAAYGAKSPDEIKKIIRGYEEAVEVAEILIMNFC